jgi:hypothetical protein
MSKKIRQGTAITLVANDWVSNDLRRTCLTEEQVIDCLVLDLTATNNTQATPIDWCDILGFIDARLTKDAEKVLLDATLKDFLVLEKLDKGQYVIPGTIVAAGGTGAIQVILPFHSPGRKRAEDSSLVVKSCKSLSLELQDRTLQLNVNLVLTANIGTALLFEKIGKGLPVNTERYVRREAIDINAAADNWRKDLNAHPYTRLMIQSDSDLANITRIEIYGKDGMIWNGDPIALNALAQYLTDKDLHSEHLLATTRPVDGEYLVIPLLEMVSDGIGKVEEQAIQIGLFTNAAFSGRLISESVSLPSTARIVRHLSEVYKGVDPALLKTHVVNQDGSLEADAAAIKAKTGNIAAVRVIPTTELGQISASTSNSKDLVNSLKASPSGNIAPARPGA